MKVMVTGSHFTPAVATIEELKKTYGAQIVYVGRKTTMEGGSSLSLESQVLPKLGVKFIPLTTGRLQRSPSIYTVPSLLKIPLGFIQSIFIILKEKPDVVLSFGGYVAVPIVFVSWLLSVPIIIFESALNFGLANKITAPFANKIAISFRKDKFKNTIFTGLPLRKEILNPSSGNLDKDSQKIFSTAIKEGLPVIFITGGNQGSHAINQAVEDGLKDLLRISCVIHQIGDSAFRDFERLSKLQNECYLAKKWIGNEIGKVLSKVDLVVSRAGINTPVETAYFGKPLLLIPIPNNEQNQNASFFENLGLARILPQSKLSGKSLVETIKEMLKDLDKLKQKARRAKEVIIADGAKRLALETVLLKS